MLLLLPHCFCLQCPQRSLLLIKRKLHALMQASDLLLLSDATMVPLPVVPTHSVVLIASCS